MRTLRSLLGVGVLWSALTTAVSSRAEDHRPSGMYAVLGVGPQVDTGRVSYSGQGLSLGTGFTFFGGELHGALGYAPIRGVALALEGRLALTTSAAHPRPSLGYVSLDGMVRPAVGPRVDWFPWASSPLHFLAGVDYARNDFTGDRLLIGAPDNVVDFGNLGGPGVLAHVGVGLGAPFGGALTLSVLHTGRAHSATTAFGLGLAGVLGPF